MLVAALGFFLYGCTGRNPEKAFDKGDYLTAARLWLERAERGDRTALCPMIAALNVIHNTAKVQALWDRQQALDLLRQTANPPCPAWG